MILIERSSDNNVVLTLTELLNTSPVLEDYTFLFEFTNDMTGEVKLFTAEDTSPATTRYNRFTITESDTEDHYNGTVKLSPAGYWSYTVYEMEGASPPNLDPEDAVATLETGKVLVTETESADSVFDDDDDKDNIIFDN